MKKLYKIGKKFEVCTVEYLTDVLGWREKINNIIGRHYYHEDYDRLSISPNMMNLFTGKTLTIRENMSYGPDWYGVKENVYYWPVAIFFTTVIDFSHTCEEGMTPIDGWFICKTCGTNLKEIK